MPSETVESLFTDYGIDSDILFNHYKIRLNGFIFKSLTKPNSSSVPCRVSSSVCLGVPDPNTFTLNCTSSELASCPKSFVFSTTCIEVECELSVEYTESHFDSNHFGKNITAILDSAMSSPAFSAFFKPDKVEGLYGRWYRVSYNTVKGGKGMIVSLSSASALGLGSLLFFLFRRRSSESRKKLEEMKSAAQNENENETSNQPRGDMNGDNSSWYDNSQLPEAVPLSQHISAASHYSMESTWPKPLTPIIAELKAKKRMIEKYFSSQSEGNNPDEMSVDDQNHYVSGLLFDKQDNDLGQSPFSKSKLYSNDEDSDDIEAQSPQPEAKIARAA